MNNGWTETKFAQASLFANPGADFYKFSTKRFSSRMLSCVNSNRFGYEQRVKTLQRFSINLNYFAFF